MMHNDSDWGMYCNNAFECKQESVRSRKLYEFFMIEMQTKEGGQKDYWSN